MVLSFPFLSLMSFSLLTGRSLSFLLQGLAMPPCGTATASAMPLVPGDWGYPGCRTERRDMALDPQNLCVKILLRDFDAPNLVPCIPPVAAGLQDRPRIKGSAGRFHPKTLPGSVGEQCTEHRLTRWQRVSQQMDQADHIRERAVPRIVETDLIQQMSQCAAVAPRIGQPVVNRHPAGPGGPGGT